MKKNILLNNSEFHFSMSDLPCLIHGVDHAGASLFTVIMMVDLYRQSNKILFVSGYHMARDEFISQTDVSDEIIHLQKEEQFTEAIQKKVVFIQKENISLLQSFVKILPDFNERVVLLKNFDLFDESVFRSLMSSQHIVLSGDLDRCSYAEEIIQLLFKTKIFFSVPKTNLEIQIPSLSKYQGFMQTENRNGHLSIGVSK